MFNNPVSFAVENNPFGMRKVTNILVPGFAVVNGGKNHFTGFRSETA